MGIVTVIAIALGILGIVFLLIGGTTLVKGLVSFNDPISIFASLFEIISGAAMVIFAIRTLFFS